MIARAVLTPRRMNGRNVLDTGSVCIGLLAETKPQRDVGVYAELMQRVLMAPLPASFIETRPALWKRLVRLLERA